MEGKANNDPFEVNLRDRLAKKIGAKYVACFDEGGLAIAVVGESNEQKYFIDKTGKKIAGPFHHAKSFKEDLARIRKDDGYYFINREGKEVIGPLDGHVEDFDEGAAAISEGPFVHFINKKGEKVDNKKVVKKPKSERVDKKTEWPISKKEEDGFYLINKKGEKVAGPFYRIDDFSEGLALVNVEKKGNDYGDNYFVNEEGKIVLGPYYGYLATGFNDGTAVVMKEDKEPYRIDHNGKRVFS